MNLTPVTYTILYNNRNITTNISDYLVSLRYNDRVEAASDEVELTLDDKDGLWQNDWYPDKSARLTIAIIDEGVELNCGTFTIDELGLESGRGDGDLVTIRGVAAGITKKLRTRRSTAHENKTLRQLAQFVADRHGLELQGDIPVIQFQRITQNRESDLAFLNRIAQLYGMVFSIRDNKLTFERQEALEKRAPVATIDKTDAISFSFTDKTIYKEVTVKHHNPKTKKVVEKTQEVGGDYTTGSDTLEVKEKVENEQQAEAMAESKTRRVAGKEKTCSVTLPGNVLLVAGMNVELTGFGKLSGIYHIIESEHDLSRGGYETTLEAKWVGQVAPEKRKPRKKARRARRGSSAAVKTGPIKNVDQLSRPFAPFVKILDI